jgi:hypothetical protein
MKGIKGHNGRLEDMKEGRKGTRRTVGRKKGRTVKGGSRRGESDAKNGTPDLAMDIQGVLGVVAKIHCVLVCMTPSLPPPQKKQSPLS